jgi:hypothetical protein
MQTIGEMYDLFLEQNYNTNPNYNGEYNDDGNMHGIGSITKATCEYEGEFKDGSITGRGIYNWVNGDAYVGDLVNGHRHGFGSYYYESGNSYEGDWCNNLRHGFGVFFYTNGGIYNGEWENNKRCGNGIYRINDKIHYDGEWKNDEKWGYGTLYNEDGTVAEEGYFYNGMPVSEYVFHFNKKYGTNFSNEDYEKFVGYIRITGLYANDALVYCQSCHICNSEQMTLGEEFCSVCDVKENYMVCYRGEECLICQGAYRSDKWGSEKDSESESESDISDDSDSDVYDDEESDDDDESVEDTQLFTQKHNV